MKQKRDYTDAELSHAARVLAAAGAKIGGHARWKNTTSEQRSEYFRQLALRRWQQYQKSRPNENTNPDFTNHEENTK